MLSLLIKINLNLLMSFISKTYCLVTTDGKIIIKYKIVIRSGLYEDSFKNLYKSIYVEDIRKGRILLAIYRLEM